MTRALRFLALLTLAGGLATPALADHDRQHRWHGHGKPHHAENWSHRRQARPDCPPGLVWYGGECLRRDRFAHQPRPRIGQVLRPADYRRIGDPGLYALQPDPRWSYYRDDNQIYRVDRHSQKVLAILQLVQALSR